MSNGMIYVRNATQSSKSGLEKRRRYQSIAAILDVVYSITDNTIELRTFNDQGLVNPLTLDDILTAIRCYPDNATMAVCIDGGAK